MKKSKNCLISERKPPNKRSNLQKCFLTIKEIERQPAGGQVTAGEDKLTGMGGTMRSDTAEEELRDFAVVDKALQHVDGNRVHADHGEKERPLPPAEDIDKPIEEREHRRRIRADAQGERGRMERRAWNQAGF